MIQMAEKIKVAWICSFSNELIRSRVKTKVGFLTKLMWKIIKNRVPKASVDRGIWNTNAFKEFENLEEVEMHVITPCAYLVGRIAEFTNNGIVYHVFHDETSNLLTSVFIKLAKPSFYPYKHNRRIISDLLKQIDPDIVHLIGAENPAYSLSILDIPSSVPTIVQLQTLMNDPDFCKNYPIDNQSYNYRAEVEKQVLLKADYIGTRVDKFIRIIKESIKPNAIFVSTSLAVGEALHNDETKKEFDFVYFASNISKAADVALEAFGIAFQKKSNMTLDVIGEYSSDMKRHLDLIIDQYGFSDAVTFEGSLETHEDVLRQIRKSKNALLPLKIDITSGTIREAMANGLPVITTDTGEKGTQLLNLDYQTVLISPKNDCKAIAHNMLMLSESEELSQKLRNNAYRRLSEEYDNEKVVNEYLLIYKECIASRQKLKGA